MHTQVLIVGAGPVGLTMAAELARYGVSVRIVDKAPQRTDKSKALVLWSRTLELLERGPGSARFIAAGFKAQAVNFIAGDKLIGRVDMGAVDTPFPFGLMIPQADTERLLEEYLAELGVTVERGVEVTDFSCELDGVTATLLQSDGSDDLVSAEWLIGCDGAHSLVRHTVGAPFTGETMPSDWMLADVHMRGYPCPDSEASVYWHKDGAFVIFPISPGRYRLIADLPPSGEAHPPTPTLEQVQAVIQRRGPPGMTAHDPIWLAGFRINGRKVSNYRWGRAFLVGDAAHVHSPAGGQGMNTGMQDAFNLAWKLALVVGGECRETLLDSYSLERSFVGDQVLKSAQRLTVVGTLKNPVARTVRNAVGHVMLGLASVKHAFADTMTQVSVGYPAGPLNGVEIHGDGYTAGERYRPALEGAPSGIRATPHFQLFASSDIIANALPAPLARLVESRIGPDLGDRLYLVRPDGYLACSTRCIDDVSAYLNQIAPPQAPAA
ncbi:MAG: monooxygenase [Alphaproteobacteria bacterium]|nr:monooxygenase [Alphaproteobacteria bacterium]